MIRREQWKTGNRKHPQAQNEVLYSLEQETSHDRSDIKAETYTCTMKGHRLDSEHQLFDYVIALSCKMKTLLLLLVEVED